MRSAESVKLKSGSSEYIACYIPPRWEVIEVTVGDTKANTYLWLQCTSYGIDTEVNLKKILNEYYYNAPQFEAEFGDVPRSEIYQEGLRAGLKVDDSGDGLHVYIVETLANVEMYSRPDFKGTTPLPIG